VKIFEIIKFIETFAPLELQDSFDNSGLQIGNVFGEVKGILLCLDITEKVIDEAIEQTCNLIISHHPLLFNPLKKIVGQTYVERCIVKACKNDITIYSAHTNLDNAVGGLNFRLAEKIGLRNIKVLRHRRGELLKLVTFVPLKQVETVRNALFDAGAGNIGDYDFCSFNSIGEGTFRAGENSHPFVGECGKFHVEKEIRIETVFPSLKKREVLNALLASHPYEEPVYDFYPLLNSWDGAGTGVIGELITEENEKSFLKKIKAIFHLKTLEYSSFIGKTIRKVALCGGSGAFLIQDAIACKADVFLTGEAKYNDFYEVENKILLAIIGHYESEYCAKGIFFDIISKKIPNIALYLSDTDTNPVNYM
jgi:dinuclear metal center YbgI/SA1388 family protein